MKFSVCTEGPGGNLQAIGTVEMTKEAYQDDDSLIAVLVEAGYVDRNDVLDVNEDDDEQVDIFEYESGVHRVSLVLIH